MEISRKESFELRYILRVETISISLIPANMSTGMGEQIRDFSETGRSCLLADMVRG